MREKIYYYADKPKDEEIESTLKSFRNRYDWNGLIELNSGLEIILKEIINKLIWYKNYQDNIREKSSKKLTQKEINQRYVEFTERIKDELRAIRRYLDNSQIDIDLPNTSPSILKELEDILINSNFSKTNIKKIIKPLKKYSLVEKLVANKTYEIKKGTRAMVDLLRANLNGTLKEHLKQSK